ncbi:hypothetical protein Bca4012_027212 [Brassica carinata]
MKEKMALLKEKFSKEELSKLEDALGSRTNSHERVMGSLMSKSILDPSSPESSPPPSRSS